MPADGGEGLMADDERRAEIEAVADALSWADTPDPSGRLDPNNYTGLAAAAIRALGRVRDARGDNEVDGITEVIRECHLRPEGVSPRQIAEEVVQHMKDFRRDARGDEEAKVTVEPGRRPFDPAKAARGDDEGRGADAERKRLAEDNMRRVDAWNAAARFPQDEDHEARRAAHEAAQAWVDAAGGDEVDTGHVVDEALNAYFVRVSASVSGMGPDTARLALQAADDTLAVIASMEVERHGGQVRQMAATTRAALAPVLAGFSVDAESQEG